MFNTETNFYKTVTENNSLKNVVLKKKFIFKLKKLF